MVLLPKTRAPRGFDADATCTLDHKTELLPGVHKCGSALSLAAAVTVYLQGGPTDTFTIAVNGAVSVGANAKVVLRNSDKVECTAENQLIMNCPDRNNVVWASLGALSVGASAHLVGTFLVNAAATLVSLLGPLYILFAKPYVAPSHQNTRFFCISGHWR